MNEVEAGNAVVSEDVELLRVDPESILPSPFGNDVNLPATEAEEESLEKSVAEHGVQNPIICTRLEDGRLRCLGGTRRLGKAKKCNLKSVPVRVVKFESEEAERQFAIKDNVERRQLTMGGKAKLALLLWNSYKKSSQEKGKAGDSAARENAATAASISAGTLFNYKFVLDYGDPETIEAMQAEKIAIGAAYTKTKARIDGPEKETAITRSVRANKMLSSLKGQMILLKALPKLAEQLANLSKAATKCKTADKERLKKRLSCVRDTLAFLKAENTIDKILDAIARVETELAS